MGYNREQRKMKKYFFNTIAIVAVVLFVCTSCVKPPTDVESVSLDIVCIMLASKDFVILTATVSPESAINKNVTWSSDKPAIATVNEGNVKAISEGVAHITVTTEDGNKTASCKVTVTNTPGR